ncbi:MAG: ISKra4 family transposase [Chloroflexi bacterium]|nr:ISKra4 family transposase [Chloroflexota bacterium]
MHHALTLPVAGLRQPCPGCGKRRSLLDWRLRHVVTICGTVSCSRPYYYCRKCKQGWAPADASLGVEPYGRVSGGLREWLADLGASTVFRDAPRLLRKLAGLEVASETVRQQSTGVGLSLEAGQQAASAQVQRSGEATEPVQRAPGLLVVETDGVMVRFLDKQWHEVKVGVVGGYQGGKLREQSYVAARETAETFGPRLLAAAARRGALEVVAWPGPVTGKGLAVLREVGVLGDGAVWIGNLAGEHLGDGVEIVDYCHGCEHLRTVANTLYGKGSEAAAAWATVHRGELYEQGADPVLAALGKATAATEEAGEVLRRERGYFRSNRERMDYPRFRALGLPLGSGAVEGSAKYVVQQRMKRPGMRWSAAGAQGALTLRTHLLSGRSVARVRPLLVPVEQPRPRKQAAA